MSGGSIVDETKKQIQHNPFGKNTVFGQLEDPTTRFLQDTASGGDPLPDPASAGPPPNPRDATMRTLHAQLQQEMDMKKMRTLFTGPMGTLGGMSASSVLLGGN